MDRHDFILGGIALVAGTLLGLLLAPRGASVEDLTSALDARLASVEGAASAAGDGVSALQTQVEEQVGALRTQVDESVTSLQGEFGALGDRIGSVEESVSNSADTMAERLSSEFSGRFESLGSAISDQSSSLQSRLEGFRESLTGGGSSSADAPDAGASAGGSGGGGTGIGQTAALADGSIRAFVSRIDEDAENVRLSINGESRVVAVGETVDITADDQNCELTVDSIDDGMVALSGTCG